MEESFLIGERETEEQWGVYGYMGQVSRRNGEARVR
jgi:hypothetical protein